MQRSTWLGASGRLAVIATIMLPAFSNALADPPGDAPDEPQTGELRIELRQDQDDQSPRDRPRLNIISGTPDDLEVLRVGAPTEYWLGLNCYPAGGALRAQLDLPEGQGLVVGEVVADSPAAKAGVKQNDILLTANDKSLKDIMDLVGLLNETKEKEVTLKLLRGGKSMSISVTPAKRPAQDQLIRRPEDDLTILKEEAEKHPDQPALRAAIAWLEKHRSEPLRMQFLRPGMMLPPGKQAPFPDDLSVKITKEGNKPAQVEVKQADQSWTTTDDRLDKLPEKVRGPVAGLLGRPPFPGGMNFNIHVPGPPGGRERGPDEPLPPGREGERGPRGPQAERGGRPGEQLAERLEERLHRQFEQMNHRMDEMRRQIDDLRSQRLDRMRRPERPDAERPERPRRPERPERPRRPELPDRPEISPGEESDSET